MPTRTEQYLEKLKKEDRLAALLKEASEENTAPERLSALAKEGGEVVSAVAKNPSTPTTVLEELAQQEDTDLALSLLQNPRLPESCFEALAKSKTDAVTGNATRTHRHVQRALAACPRTPAHILEQLSGVSANRAFITYRENPLGKTFVALAQNPNTPPEVLERLSDDRYRRVWVAAQQNPNNPLYVKNPVRRRSRANYLYTRWVYPGDEVPESLAGALASAPNEMTRGLVARSPSLSQVLIAQLSKDSSLVVRESLAARQDLPQEIIEQLSRETDMGVRLNLINNPSVPAALRAQLSSRYPKRNGVPVAPRREPSWFALHGRTLVSVAFFGVLFALLLWHGTLWLLLFVAMLLLRQLLVLVRG